MSKKRTVTVRLRGKEHQITPKHAAELNRRGHLLRRPGCYMIEDIPFLQVRDQTDQPTG